MTYDYNKFLNDSSDDYPKYADGLEVDQLEFEFMRPSEWFANQDKNQPVRQLPAEVALENVIVLAQAGMDSLGMKTDIWGTISADAIIARDSIDLVKEIFFKKV
jgi:hypothetical protein